MKIFHLVVLPATEFNSTSLPLTSHSTPLEMLSGERVTEDEVLRLCLSAHLSFSYCYKFANSRLCEEKNGEVDKVTKRSEKSSPEHVAAFAYYVQVVSALTT